MVDLLRNCQVHVHVAYRLRVLLRLLFSFNRSVESWHSDLQKGNMTADKNKNKT